MWLSFIPAALERLRLMRPDTRRFFEQSASWLDAVHGYLYARFTQTYINALLSPRPQPGPPHPAAAWFARHYHAKVLTHDHARAIVVNELVVNRDLEQVIPFPIARRLVLDGPPDIAVYECVCRHARASHCTPTQVCMIVGQPMVDMILRMHPDKSRRLSQPEALALLEAEHARGHVHTAWFKDAVLGRFYALCNCCQCCCGGINIMRNNGVRMLAASGFAAHIDPDLCSLCGQCADACPFGALTQSGDAVTLDWAKCMGCGVCQTLCPSSAATLVRDERKGTPLDVRAL